MSFCCSLFLCHEGDWTFKHKEGKIRGTPAIYILLIAVTSQGSTTLGCLWGVADWLLFLPYGISQREQDLWPLYTGLLVSGWHLTCEPENRHGFRIKQLSHHNGVKMKKENGCWHKGVKRDRHQVTQTLRQYNEANCSQEPISQMATGPHRMLESECKRSPQSTTAGICLSTSTNLKSNLKSM